MPDMNRWFGELIRQQAKARDDRRPPPLRRFKAEEFDLKRIPWRCAFDINRSIHLIYPRKIQRANSIYTGVRADLPTGGIHQAELHRLAGFDEGDGRDALIPRQMPLLALDVNRAVDGTVRWHGSIPSDLRQTRANSCNVLCNHVIQLGLERSSLFTIHYSATPIDGNTCAADEFGVLRGEEEQHTRNLLSFGPAAEIGAGHAGAIGWRIYDARQDGVDGDVGVAQFLGLHLRQRHHGILGDGVGGGVAATAARGPRRDMDDTSPVLLGHRASGMFGKQERRIEVDVEHALPCAVFQPGNRLTSHPAADQIDQDIEAMVPLHYRPDQRFDLRLIGDIGAIDAEPLRQVAQLFAERVAVASMLPASGGDDHRARLQKGARDRLTSAAQPARNQRHSPTQIIADHRLLLVCHIHTFLKCLRARLRSVSRRNNTNSYRVMGLVGQTFLSARFPAVMACVWRSGAGDGRGRGFSCHSARAAFLLPPAYRSAYRSSQARHSAFALPVAPAPPNLGSQRCAGAARRCPVAPAPPPVCQSAPVYRPAPGSDTP